nr:DUF411 domain-containing protein [Pseudomonas aeruginosa]
MLQGLGSHLQGAGFDVQVLDTGNTAAARGWASRRVRSCHTAQIAAMPSRSCACLDIQRLLREAPQAIGLAAPGMPVGSPGMDGRPMVDARRLRRAADWEKRSSTVYQSHR